jgi:hypothetical protein
MLSEGRVVAPQSLITAYPEALTSITQQPSLRLG